MSIPAMLKSLPATLKSAMKRATLYSSLVDYKLDLIDLALVTQKVRSLADLGGVWGIDGGYTFYALDNYNLDKSVLVDTHPTDAVMARSGKYPQFQFVKGNFGDTRVAEQVGQVDAVILFDVLLHQVSPDWDSVLEMYANRSRCLIILNQQWIRPGKTTRLLDLGEDEYFRNVPFSKYAETYNNLFQKLSAKHPDHGDRLWRDVHHIWQWGITDADLIAKITSLGFRLQYFKNCGQFHDLVNFENHAFLFSK
jgi:hypothetical protein